MRCPQCGARNLLGSESCSNCGRPFTRAATRDRSKVAAGSSSPNDETARVPTVPRQPRRDVHVHYERDAAYDDYYDYDDRYYDPPPRRRGFATMGCLPALVVLLAVAVGVIIGLIIATNMYVRPRVTDAIADNIGARIETTVAEQVTSELGDIPAGEVTIREADINQRIDERGNLGPIENLTVNIVPSGVEADMSAYGLSGGYSADVQHQDGQIVLTNGEVSGPLQYLVSEGDVTRIASNAINRSLADAGYRVEGVTLHDGEIVLSLAR